MRAGVVGGKAEKDILVDRQLVWLTVKERIPAVEPAIRQILRELEAPAPITR